MIYQTNKISNFFFCLERFISLRVGVGGGVVGGVGVCGPNICYQVAAFMIQFNLICNMTMYPTPRVVVG